jgi:hypothetical protein
MCTRPVITRLTANFVSTRAAARQTPKQGSGVVLPRYPDEAVRVFLAAYGAPDCRTAAAEPRKYLARRTAARQDVA